MNKLLTRDNFREGVFSRDAHRCVVRNQGIRCSNAAVDAHHILERRLFGDGGYYLANGASVCEQHHLDAEKTLLSCEDLREWCGIKEIVLPEHLYRDQPYDKWGNPILPNGQRMQGELFNDTSVQTILAASLHLFTHRVKYPRTYHLPFSPGVTKDDRVMKPAAVDALLQDDVVITVKMDGENTTMYRDGIHARSLDYEPHPSRDWVKALHARIAHEIPENWRICGENLFAKHSIHYKNLDARFLVFSIWDGLRCLGWDETVAYADVLGLSTVPVVPSLALNRKSLETLGATITQNGWGEDACEGYVIRRADSFMYGEFRAAAGKFVRANHVQTHGHWMRSSVTPNETRS